MPMWGSCKNGIGGRGVVHIESVDVEGPLTAAIQQKHTG